MHRNSVIILGMSANGRGCVKTLFESSFGANLLDFRKLQFAKALISLKLKFGQFGFNLDLIRSLTFSHSLGPKPTSSSNCRTSAQLGRPDIEPAMPAFSETWSACRGHSSSNKG